MNLRISPKVQQLFSKNLWYVPMLATAMGLMFVRLAIVARMLPVAEFASYSAGLLISSSFCMLACFGLHWLLQRDLPIMIIHRRERAGGVLLLQCVLVAVLSAAAGGLVILVLEATLVGLTTAGVLLSLFHGLSQQLFTVTTVDSRSRNLPVQFARENLERAVILIVAAPIIIASGGGALTILFIEGFVTIALSAHQIFAKFSRNNLGFLLTLSIGYRAITKVRWRTALTLLAVSSLGFVVLNIDRWVGAQWLSVTQFGNYAFAWTLLSIAQSVQTIINASFYPMISQRYALIGRYPSFIYTAKFAAVTFGTGLILSAILYNIVSFLMDNFYPNYSDAKELLPYFFIIVAFRTSDFWPSFLIVTRQDQRLLFIMVFTTACTIATWAGLQDFNFQKLKITDLGALALMVTVTNYIAAALFAWKSSFSARKIDHSLQSPQHP